MTLCAGSQSPSEHPVPKTRKAKPVTRAKRGTRSADESATRERAVQRSVSLRPSQWQRLDVLGDLTQWGRNGALTQAVDFYTTLPVAVTQRIATLRRTTAGAALRDRLRAAVEDAIKSAEAELPGGPWAEFDAALLDAADAFEESGATRRSERELVAAAEEGKRLSRQKRLGRTSRLAVP
mgnify:FL=1